MKFNKKNLIGLIILLLATISWGTSFIILKNTIETVSTFYVLAIRFTLSALILGVIFIKTIIKTPPKTIIKGIILGVILTFAYDIQTFGLAHTTPSRNAFLTASYCILTPFLAWFLIKDKPKAYNVIAAVLGIVGIGLVVFSGTTDNGKISIGDLLTLGSAIFYALQIIYIDKFQKEGNSTIGLLVYELLTVGVVNIILSLIFDLPKGINVYTLNLNQFTNIIYLTLVCTLFAQLAMMVGQKLTTANQASLVLSMESVFGALFSVILGDEVLKIGLIIGFVVILLAMLVNELKINPIKLLSGKKSISNENKN